MLPKEINPPFQKSSVAAAKLACEFVKPNGYFGHRGMCLTAKIERLAQNRFVTTLKKTAVSPTYREAMA